MYQLTPLDTSTKPITPRHGFTGNTSIGLQGQQLEDQRARDRAETYRRNYENTTKATDLKVDELDIAKLGAQTDIGNLLEDYNKTRGEMMAKSQSGLLSAEDVSKLKAKEVALYSEYKNALTSQENFKSVMTQANQHQSEVNWEILQPAKDAYVKEGKPFTLTTVPLLPIDVYGTIANVSKSAAPSSTPIENVTIKDASGKVRVGTARISPNDEQGIRNVIKAAVFSQNRVTDDTYNKFEEWRKTASIDEQKKFLPIDENASGSIDPNEERSAILRWAYQDPKMREAAMGFQDDKPKVASATASKGVPVKWGKREVVMPIGEKRTEVVTYGGITRPNLYSFGGTFKLTDVPTANAHLLYDTTRDATPLGGSNLASAVLKDYDADRDVLIVQMTTGDPTLGAERVQLVEVPAKDIPYADTFPVMVNGKQTNLGTLRGTSQNVTTTPKKKKFNYVTGKLEEVTE